MPDRHIATIRETTSWVFARVEAGDGRRYAVKQVRGGLDDRGRAQAVARLREEFEFLRKAGGSARLLAPVAADDAAGRFAYEDVQGSLRQWADQRGPMRSDDVALVLLDALDALAALHARKIGHGSVGLRTLLVDPAGRVKVGDFVGYPLKTGTPHPAYQGGLKYQAPELLRPDAPVTADPGLGRADMYTLGYAALELLVGKDFGQLFGFPADAAGFDPNWLAWHHDLAAELDLTNVLQTAHGLEEVLTRLVRKNPGDRVWEAAKLKDHLERKGIHANKALAPLDARAGKAGRGGRRPTDPTPAGLTPAVPDLVVTRGGDAPGPPVTAADTLLVGREPTCQVVLADTGVSRKHCLFARAGDAWHVYDLNTRAGTVVNDQRVRAARVRGRTVVRVGAERLVTRQVLRGHPEFDYYELPPYRPVEPLHRGRQGDLFLAVHDRTKAARAVRVYPGLPWERKGLQKFIRGVRAAGKLDHPHVLPVFFAGSVSWAKTGEPTWYLATEYMAGGSLRDQVQAHGKLPPWQVARFARDVAAALQAAEQHRLVHRSINPACILFTAGGLAKLGDFSLMREDVLEQYQQITTQNFELVDQGYRPPEAVRGEPLTPAADLYSLAVCMYEAATGRPPYAPDPSLTAMMKKVCDDQPPHVQELEPAVPAGLAAVIERGMSKAPADRYGSAREFLHALAAADADAA